MGFNQIGFGPKTSAFPGQAVSLASGQVYVLPSGQYMVLAGQYTFLQWYDPVSTLWRSIGNTVNSESLLITSDGTNYRLANLTGGVVGAIVTTAGSGYTNGIYYPSGFPLPIAPNWSLQLGTAVAPTVSFAAAGGSVPAQGLVVVGGAVATSIAITAAGSGYTRAPTILISPPPTGGLQATADCTISGGVINAVTVRNQGAGYTTAPTITVVNNPQDTTGSGAVLTASLTGSGTVTAITVPVNGVGMTSVPAITVTGGTAAATALGCLTATSVTFAGTASLSASLGVIGSALPAVTPVYTNPLHQEALFTPRMGFTQFATAATINTAYTLGNATLTQRITDGGLHMVAPGGVAICNGTTPTVPTAAPTVAAGGTSDVSMLIPV
jgi:hypothetical protein